MRNFRRRRLTNLVKAPFCIGVIPMKNKKMIYMIVAFFSVIVLWSVATYGGFIDSLFLPTPTAVIKAGIDSAKSGTLFPNIWISVYRVLGGFIAAAVLAVPLGIIMGMNEHICYFFEPIISLIRYMPASAFVPLFILWLGIGEVEKMAVIFYGTFFYLTLMVVDVIKNIPKNLIEASRTLGASSVQMFFLVIFKAAAPGIVDSLRTCFGMAWTYLCIAELVSATSGIGYMITIGAKFLHSDQMILGIVVIGLLGVLSDSLFGLLYNKRFWYLKKGK